MHTIEDVVQLWGNLEREFGYGPYDCVQTWADLYEDIRGDQGDKYAYECMVGYACEFRDNADSGEHDCDD